MEHPLNRSGFSLRHPAHISLRHGAVDLMVCDVKPLVVRLMCLSMYCLHTTVIRRDRSRGKMIPKIIFTIFVNLRMDSPANTLLASKERLDLLENDLVYQTHLSQS